MPLRRLAGRDRSTTTNWQLAALLAFTAGTVDVSGYLALHQFTSHVSGLVASMAAELAERGFHILLGASLLLASFLAGAAVCAILINWSRRRGHESLYAVPVLLEALLLASLIFLPAHLHASPALVVLSFSMGLQNAIITKISHAEIRTTHITGMVTDIGIELGKAFYWNRKPHTAAVQADRRRLLLLIMLVSLFFAGGATGAFAYPRIGFEIMLPLAVLLALPTVLPIFSDLN
jgi:uncharacterized membrane protein YoaK (UPF0700 family)